MQKTVIFLCLFFSSFIISAQTKKESYNSLLWRISGNGLTRPSYLYGTIHITDKRVFYFSDSLYKSIEQSEGFAAELDMTSFFSEHFGSITGEKKKRSEKLLVDSLDPKILTKYKVKLEDKFNKPLNKITVGDIEDAKDEWMNFILANGEMNTPMDAWLFDLARRQGKWVGGVEDYEDQETLEDSIALVEKIESYSDKIGVNNPMLEWMISIYLRQDLDSIDRTDNMFQGSRDALLVRRNIKMARRMDSLARIRSMFFAVGAAHIPTNDGVVYLLRQRGFTVTPVYSKNKIAPEEYTYKKVELPWFMVEDTTGIYKIEMPGKPISSAIQEDEEVSLNMKLYADIGSMRYYMTMSIPIPTTNENNMDSMLVNFVGYYKKTGDSVTEKNVVVNGKNGKELTGFFDKIYMRMQFCIEQSTLVMMTVAGFKKPILYGDDPDKFFNSLKINPRQLTKKVEKKWHRYEFDKLGFSVESPIKFREEKMDRDNGSWEQSVFQTFDLAETIYMGMVISTIKKGYYSRSDSTYFNEAAEKLVANMNAELVKKEHFLYNGYPAFTGLAKVNADSQNLVLRLFFLNKGPRRYLLFTTSSDKGEENEIADRFLRSLKFLNEENPHWKKQMPADKSFSTWSPSIMLPESDLAENGIEYIVVDSISKLQFFIDKETFPPYFWADNDSALLSDKVRTYVTYSDSVIYNKSFSTGKIPGADLLVQMNETHNLKRLRAYMNGDTVYTVYSFLPAQYLEQKDVDRFFTDFKISQEKVSTNLYKRKPQELLIALQAKDSAGFAKASETFKYVSFLQEDVPLLQKALLYPYYDFDSTYFNGTNRQIAGLIWKLDSNNTSISFIKDNYGKIPADCERLKPFLLQILSYIKTSDSYNLLKELIVKSPPKVDQGFYWQNGLYDSLPLTKNLFPEIISLAGDPGMYDFVNDLTLRMIDSNLIEVSVLKKYKNEFIRTAKRLLTLSSERQEEEYYHYLSLVKLLGKLNDAEANEMLKKIGAININSLKLDVVLAQAAGGQQPDTKSLKLLAGSDEFRQYLYEGLKERKRINLYPKEFLSQKLLAQSQMFNYANEDDNPPDKIEYVGERTELFMGKKQKFYLFKICFLFEEGKDDDECYFGLSGPYSLVQNNFETSNDASEILWDDYFDKGKINEWFRDALKRTEKWIKERDVKREIK